MMYPYLGYLRQYLRQELSPWYALSLAVLLGIAIYINYTTLFFFEWLNELDGTLRGLWAQFSFYALAYFGAVLLYVLICRKWQFMKRLGFWATSIGALLILALYSSADFHRIPARYAHPDLALYLRQTGAVSLRTAAAVLLIILHWALWHRKQQPLYGFKHQGVHWKPYLLIAAAVVPIVWVGSLRADFLEQYPRYAPGPEAGILGVPPWATTLFFEFWYGFDFLFVELFFRGLLILGLSRYMGSAVVMPMVAAYAFLHFQKPWGETVCSVLGGGALGVISLRSGSIYGGLVVHLTVAWGMEIMAAGQKGWLF